MDKNVRVKKMRKRIPVMDTRRIERLIQESIKAGAKESGIPEEQYRKELSESFEQFFGEKSLYV